MLLKSCSIIIIILSIIFMIPLEYFLFSSFILSKESFPTLFFHQIKKLTLNKQNKKQLSLFYNKTLFISIGPLNNMIRISPNITLDIKITEKEFINWFKQNEVILNNLVLQYGGILFRGFNIKTIQNFENIVNLINSNTRKNLVPSPITNDNLIENSSFSFIRNPHDKRGLPPHLQFSFKGSYPDYVYLYANEIIEEKIEILSGSVSLTDFRLVWKEIPDRLKEKLMKRGIIHELWYCDENSVIPLSDFQPSWQKVFNTTDPNVVDDILSLTPHQGTRTWDGNDLVIRYNSQIPCNHRKTHEEYWCINMNLGNRLGLARSIVYDAQLYSNDFYKKIIASLGFFEYLSYWIGAISWSKFLYADTQTELSLEDILLIQQITMKNTWIFPLYQEDLIILDNQRIGYGRPTDLMENMLVKAYN